MFEAFITNLGRYNEGHLDGEYLKLPATTEQVQALLKRIHVDGVQYEEIFITDYDIEIPGLYDRLGEYESIDELNYLAALLEEMDNGDLEKFAAAVEYGEYTGSVKDLINLTQNLDCYDYFPGVNDDEDLGYYLIDEMGMLDIPDHIQPYFDYEAYGRDVSIEDSGTFTENGYIIMGGGWIELYNGRDDIPDEYRIFAYPEQEKSILAAMKNYQQMISEKQAIIGQVTAMEQQLAAAVQELTAMRRDLAEMEKRNHPLKNAMRKAVITMQNHVLELRDKLATLKQSVIDGCKNAITAFKEKGIAALDNIARFFKVRPILEAIHTGADKAAQSADKAIANIETASARYHEAGRNLKNAGRALTGKEAVQETKPTGKAAKAFMLPYRATGAAFRGIRNHAAHAVSNLKRLEEKAKPSIKKDMEKFNEQIAREVRDAPKRARSRPSPEI